MKILGIDPGSRITGYGIIAKESEGLKGLEYGEIRQSRGESFSAVLVSVYERLTRLIAAFQPDALAIEDIFFGKNVQSLIKQGHVRGVAILAGARKDVPVYEYTPLEVKKAVVGYGRAEKRQVQTMIGVILKLRAVPPPDAADALAVAVCHANFSGPAALP
ncbi:MAG TPA: crossover junction endodeoxyribonuclease RuvC [Syntrophales bacterium]|jgi:crossover junction endodeoxyribonuclease RuvC|nr:crossover junction endodeoxyribonuclease RuvC [Syntrophales bacterium]